MIGYDEFIGRVQVRSHLRSRTEAERITRAALNALAECLPEGTARKLAAQLPVEIGNEMLRPATVEQSRSISMDDFLRRVSERAGMAPSDLVRYVGGVIDVIGETVSEELMEQLQEELPQTLHPLLALYSPAAMLWEE